MKTQTKTTTTKTTTTIPNEWKWSNGTFAEKSARIQNTKIDSSTISSLNNANTLNTLNENKAYIQSLDLDSVNKREYSWEKMAERQMVGQIGMNPFLDNHNSYADDICVQNEFLQPTTLERERNSSDNTNN